MPRLSLKDRKRLIGLHKEGISNRKIGKLLNCSEGTVRLTIKRYNGTGTIQYLPVLGRPKKTTVREDRNLKLASLKNRYLTAPDLQKQCGLVGTCCLTTVRSRLRSVGLNGCIARRKPMVSLKNRKRRLEFARSHGEWEAPDWRRIVFSDECKFNRLASDGRQYVRRKFGEEFKPRCTVSTLQGGGGSVIVWGDISVHVPGCLTSLYGRVDFSNYVEMLEEHFIPI